MAIKGFERRKTEEELKLLRAPEILKSSKEKISEELEAFSKETKGPEKVNVYAQLIAGKVDYSKLLAQAKEAQGKREASKLEDIYELSQAVILTTLAQKADRFDVELDKLGQNTVIGSALFSYFRKDYCIYLTKTMFKYLNLLAVSLCERRGEAGLSICILPSLSALIRLIKINLRCLAICKINLDQIVLPEEYESFNQMRAMFNANFGTSLRAAVEARAAEEKTKMEAKVKAKAEQAALEQSRVEEEKKAEAKPTTVQIRTDGAGAAAANAPAPEEEKKAKEDADKKDGDKEKEKEDEETVEFVEKLWKSALQYTDIITSQAKELEQMLNNIFNSTNPRARMKDLAENLELALNADVEATRKCIFVFEALTNDLNMKEIFGGNKDDFEHF